MTISSCYVFVVDGAQPRICGQYTIRDGIGYFIYGKSWRNAADSFALDPINLPLTDGEFMFATRHAEIGVLADAAPDVWGRQLQLARHRQHPANEVEWLLVGSGRGAGCLAFSASRTAPLAFDHPPAFADLTEFMGLVAAVEAGKPLEDRAEWQRLLDYGSSMGGAKPKVVVLHEGREWIAKLNRRQDLIDVARMEYATRELAVRVGIDAVPLQLHEVAGRSVLLVKRFDRDASGRRHYLSAHSLLNMDRVREDDARLRYSYGQVADIARRICDEPARDLPELYRRMVFNALIGNTDDHSRNHGFLKLRARDAYVLSPAFDVSPQPGTQHLHSLGLGNEGRLASRENLLSQASRFLLSREEAEHEIKRQCDVLQEWQSVYRAHGVSEADIQAVSSGFLSL